MRTGEAARHHRVLQLFERNVLAAKQAGLARIRVSDASLDGGVITVDGRRVLNFGSCAYLGLNVDERLKQGAIEAINRFGPVFSSSTAYTSVDLYTELEERLKRIFEATVILPTTTTLGHLAALPVLIGAGDVVLVDSQAHASVHLATQSLKALGIPVTPLAHNDLAALEAAVVAPPGEAGRIWYLADGVYSMFGDVAPVTQIVALLDRYPRLHAYIDDAHGFGWCGRNGRGYVLSQTPLHARLVVAVSLAKSFGSGGAALVFPDERSARRVQMVGSTLTFSGPIHPAELGAAVASADIHLSAELSERQARLVAQIDLVLETLSVGRLPVPAFARTPIWYARIGSQANAVEVGRRMLRDGFYLNVALFPAVPLGEAGLRFTQTLYHTDDQVLSMVEMLTHHVLEVTGKTEVIVDLDHVSADEVTA